MLWIPWNQSSFGIRVVESMVRFGMNEWWKIPLESMVEYRNRWSSIEIDGRVLVFGCDHDHETQRLSHILTCESPSPAKRLEPTNICLCEELAIKTLTLKMHVVYWRS